jgi:DNA-binding CsgD family transcriptional regulator
MLADDLSEKLEILIKLQAANLIASIESSKDKIILLSKAGLRPGLIAEILGVTPHHVNVVVSNMRKSSKTKVSSK